MKNFALMICGFAVAAASLNAISLAAPILVSALILAAVNALGYAAGFGLAPAAWSLYTALCGVRCALFLVSASVLGEGVHAATAGLGGEYLLLSALCLIYWCAREYRRRNSRRTRRCAA